MSHPFVPPGATRPEVVRGPTPHQNQIEQIPERYDLALTGGRGSGKTYAAVWVCVGHCEKYRSLARCLFVRRTHAACEDIKSTLREVLFYIYGRGVKFNANEGHFRLPNGAFIEVSQLSEESHYLKFQGRSFTMIVCDEATQHPTLRLLDLLRSNLRGPSGVVVRYIIIGNPGGPSHQQFRARYVKGVEPLVPYLEEASGRWFVSVPSTYLDNPHLDQAEYRRQLEAACAGDPELLKGWLEGSWDIARGAFFASVLSERRSAFSMTPEEFEIATAYKDNIPSIVRLRLPPLDAQLFLAHDFGVSAPSVTFVCARSPGFEVNGQYFPRDSLLLLDELSTNVPDDYTTGLGYTVPHLAEEIVELSKRWGMKRAEGVADDAVFSKSGHVAGSIAEEFRKHGCYFRPARKAQRIPGWQKLRVLMENAGKPDVPGLYVSRSCVGFWATVPTLPRDPRRTDDVDSRGPDHWADAARYGECRGAGTGGVVMPLHKFLGVS